MKSIMLSAAAVAMAGFASVAIAQPAPQYTAKDIAQSFADKPTNDATGECEKKGMVTGEDGVCEPVKDERGFSLPTKAARAGAPDTAKAAPAVKTASRAPVAGPVRRRTPPSRDLLITFKLGSSDLTDQGRANAKVFAEALALPELAGSHFELDGYTDITGDKGKNLTLSQQRAEAVKSFLVSSGVDASRLEAHGFGAQDFANTADPKSAENRRVVARKLE